MFEPVWNRNHVACVQITMAEDFGVEDRGHFYDPVGALRDVVVNHLMQVVAATAMEAPVARRPAERSRTPRLRCSARSSEADPAHYVRGQYDGYLSIDGVAAGSTTETYAALRLEIENWRWSGVPFFIRTGKRLPMTQTEVRVVFKHPPQLGFGVDARPSRTSSSSSSTPPPGSGSSSGPPRGRSAPSRRSSSTWSSPSEGGEGADPVRGAAPRRDGRRQHALHPPGRGRGAMADHAAAARRAAAGARRTRPGRWGPKEADELVAGVTAAGTSPGSCA